MKMKNWKILKSKINPKNIGYLVLVLWTIFSVVYISWGQWSAYKEKAIQASYDAGINSCVSRLITEAKNTSCQSFTVYNDKETVDVINVQCLSSDGSVQ